MCEQNLPSTFGINNLTKHISAASSIPTIARSRPKHINHVVAHGGCDVQRKCGVIIHDEFATVAPTLRVRYKIEIMSPFCLRSESTDTNHTLDGVIESFSGKTDSPARTTAKEGSDKA